MATQPQTEADTITRYDRPSKRVVDQDVTECDGCRELTERVERLEQLLGGRDYPVTERFLNTTSCYWLCVGAHAMTALALFSNAGLLQIGIVLVIGAIGTLATTQVLSTRPIFERVARSALSVSVVFATAMTGIWLGDVSEPLELAPFALMMFPPLFASAWITAKGFLWAFGWKIVPPGYSDQYPKLRIWHLMLCTLVAAVCLAVGPAMIDLSDWFDDGLFVALLFIAVPTVASTAISCILARYVLAKPDRLSMVRVMSLGMITFPVMTLICCGLLFATGEVDFGPEMILGMLIYAIPLSLGVFASSGTTYAMMRAAGYRFVGGSESPEGS